MKKAIALTGGRGFVGERLAARLVSQGHEVRILTRKADAVAIAGTAVVTGDLTLPESDLARFVNGADVLYHCAGEINDPAQMEAVHVRGTQRLIAAAEGRIGRWVQLSSVGAYGSVHSGVVTEDSPEAPLGEYERTKTLADQLLRVAEREGGFQLVILRPSIIFGPTMRNQSLFQLIRAIDRGMFFFIGPVGASVNYVHIENVIDALLLCGFVQHAAGRTYIVSDNRDLNAIVSEIATALGRRVPRIRCPESVARWIARAGAWLPGFPLKLSRVDALTNRTVYSTERIEHELAYRHKIWMEDGMREMVRVLKGDSSVIPS